MGASVSAMLSDVSGSVTWVTVCTVVSFSGLGVPQEERPMHDNNIIISETDNMIILLLFITIAPCLYDDLIIVVCVVNL